MWRMSDCEPKVRKMMGPAEEGRWDEAGVSLDSDSGGLVR